jgi:hypothetical protein
MALAARLVRALAILFVLVASYLVHLGLARLFRGQDGSLPPWLVARRRRVDSQNAKRLLAGMLRLRGVYIKLGQVLSVMGGFLPRAYAKELEQLQDQVPPHPFRDVAATIEESLGKPPSELYRDIAEEPIAAASLGQVHVAHLHDGTKVAVKVLYRGIRDVIAVDMRVLRLGIAIYKRFVPVARLERVHHALVDLLRRETDYLHEAECMRRLAKNFADDPSIAVPGVVDALTTREVLTMTFMEGLKITRLDELRAAGVDSAGRRREASSRPSTRCSSSTASSTPIPTRGTSSSSPSKKATRGAERGEGASIDPRFRRHLRGAPRAHRRHAHHPRGRLRPRRRRSCSSGFRRDGLRRRGRRTTRSSRSTVEDLLRQASARRSRTAPPRPCSARAPKQLEQPRRAPRSSARRAAGADARLRVSRRAGSTSSAPCVVMFWLAAPDRRPRIDTLDGRLPVRAAPRRSERVAARSAP